MPSLGYGSYPYGSDLPTFMHFVCFSHIFLNHASHMHTGLIASPTYFQKNLYIKCSNYIVLTKPCQPCHLSSKNNQIKSMEDKWTPNIQTHILSYPERHFMIK